VSGSNQNLNESLDARKRWFEWYVDKLSYKSTVSPLRDGPLYRCPCCHCRTLEERGAFTICPVCYWEDDGQDDDDADTVRGGPNGTLSLTAARENYIRIGACDEKFVSSVRLPTNEERS
jgi:hypothetical protein